MMGTLLDNELIYPRKKEIYPRKFNIENFKKKLSNIVEFSAQ